MKIAVLGTRGFVGRHIFEYLNQSHIVTGVTRDNLDMLDPLAVNEFLQAGRYDVIVNCAAVMTDNSTLYDARNNLGLFMNFYNKSKLFGKFINLASGAEYDRTQDINQITEELIFDRVPEDSYGWGQNIKSRLCAEKDGFYNIRIFNCFGAGESNTRIFPRYLNRQKTFEIINDRQFDYFSIQDLSTVVQDCIEKDWAINDINAVYTEKYKIASFNSSVEFIKSFNIRSSIFL
jgi:nucleoside-diphosphate-sugar epimerase